MDDMLAPQGKERLNTLLQRTDISQTLQVSVDYNNLTRVGGMDKNICATVPWHLKPRKD